MSVNVDCRTLDELRESQREETRAWLLANIRHCAGNMSAVSRRTGTDRKNLYRLMAACGISLADVEGFRDIASNQAMSVSL
jgi:DNA-binding NtrC family response regulator